MRRNQKVWTDLGEGRVLRASRDRSGVNYYVEGRGFFGWFKDSEVEGAESVLDLNDDSLDFDDDSKIETDLRHLPWDVELQDAVDEYSTLEYEASFIDDDVELTYAGDDEDGEPDPAWDWFRNEYPQNQRNSMRIFADWNDVRDKAMKMRSEGRVNVLSYSLEYIKGYVQGDHDTYQVEIVRDLGDKHVSSWSCTCGWGQWAFKREHTYIGRQCSHALAMYYEMQSMDLKSVMQSSRRTAARIFSMEEQQNLIDEPGQARQLRDLNLEGVYSPIDDYLL